MKKLIGPHKSEETVVVIKLENKANTGILYHFFSYYLLSYFSPPLAWKKNLSPSKISRLDTWENLVNVAAEIHEFRPL